MPARRDKTRAQPGTSTPALSSFVVVANRLPVDQVEDDDGNPSWRRSPGGLVTGLEPVMRKYDGAWIGWTGSPGPAPEPFDQEDMSLVPVPLSEEEIELYYEGFSNATLWPLYHDVIVAPQFHRPWWDTYVAVNQRFADRTAEVAAEGAVVWVHDYQLQLVPAMLRRQRPDLRIGFFLHIPFPPAELFLRMPWRRQLLEGLLGADLVGFQRPGAAANFVRLVRERIRHKTHRDRVYLPDGRVVRAAAYPISTDVAGMEELARKPETAERAQELRSEIGGPAKVLLGIDRLDYTKGILQRLRAFGELLSAGQIEVADAVLVQVATPSRERVGEYRRFRDEIDRLVGRINGDHGRIGAPAVHYMHTSFPREELAALFRAADVMVITPLRDGMNLVAKEYVACQYDDRGALVLSEFAGAADELRQAFLVNPYDINGVKEALLETIRADERDLARRMRAMRKHLREHDVTDWAATFLDDLVEAPEPTG